MKKVLITIMAIIVSYTVSVGAAQPNTFEWAEEAVNYCTQNAILEGMGDGNLVLGDLITNEQTAKLLAVTFLDSVEKTEENESNEDDEDTYGIDPQRWSYKYIKDFNGCAKMQIDKENLTSFTTREEFVSSLVLISGLKESNMRNKKILAENFADADKVSEQYSNLLCIATERGYMHGSDGFINPTDNITRAEACTFIYRVIRATKMGETLELGVKPSSTPLISEPSISMEQAIQWAKNMGADERFINVAPYYWEYGKQTGINPAILYAQAAKETAYGNYGGKVVPEQNNWAGIKIADATGDTTYDHESFETPKDGVRGHFNHISAYLGLTPIGEPHNRYYSVAKLSWAGTVKTLEELGGKWCPDLYYGYSILHDYIEPMMNTEVE